MPAQESLGPILTLVIESITKEFVHGIGVAVVTGLFMAWQKDKIYAVLARLSWNKPRQLKNGQWFTNFVQNGRMREEEVDCKRVAFTSYYLGRVTYVGLRDERKKYPFTGRLVDGLFTATYRNEDEGAADCGTWTLQFNTDGNVLVGGYSWLVNDAIGYDFYQWTRTKLARILTCSNSLIEGRGVFPAERLPRGTLLGEFFGRAVNAPTRESLFLEGEHIDPDENSTLRWLNHSCNPNAEFRGRLLFLLRPVDPDDRNEEITIDYTKTEQSMSTTFQCHCVSCRKSVSPRQIG